jgi:hypothetical protein
MALHLDPAARPDPERDDRHRATTARVEIRPARSIAHLATRSLACPSCGVPIVLSASVGWHEEIACAFCEGSAKTRDYVQELGHPQVALIARIG